MISRRPVRPPRGTSGGAVASSADSNDPALGEINYPTPNGGSFGSSLLQAGCPTGFTCAQLVTGDPELGTLAMHGGAVPTQLPATTSPLIDTGDDNHCPPVDARGVARPQGAACDIGAVERRDVIFVDGFDGMTPGLD